MGAIGIAGVAGMLANSLHSDRSGERVLHSAVPLVVVAAGFAMIATGRPAWTIAGLFTVTIAISAFLLPVLVQCRRRCSQAPRRRARSR